jgi:hypothetical protein
LLFVKMVDLSKKISKNIFTPGNNCSKYLETSIISRRK